MKSSVFSWSALCIALGSTPFSSCSKQPKIVDAEERSPADVGTKQDKPTKTAEEPESSTQTATAGRASDATEAAGKGGAGGTSEAKPTVPDVGTPPATKNGNPPCEVADILKASCARCHGRTLHNGAPISLVESADFQRDLGGISAGDAVRKRVKDTARPMPPPPAAMLTADQVGTLEAWIETGASPAQPGCAVDDETPSTTKPNGEGVTRADDDAGVDTLDASIDASAETPDAGPPTETVASDWPAFSRDLSNSRNNTDEVTLSKDSVGNLKELWRFDGPSTTATPAVVDGVIYLTGWNGRVYAMRLEDGSSVWTATLPDLIDSSPTVTDSQVFISDDNGAVHALDRASGDVQWSRQVDEHAEAHLWSSPVYIASANLVVVGIASGEEQVVKAQFTFRGSVVGIDADSGEIRWRHENASAASGAGPGVGSWGTAAVDEARKLVFIGTGNNYGPPSSELSDSMLAINYESGELVWSRQFTSGDIYTVYGGIGPDFDIGSSANLFSVAGRDIVGIGVKSGNYFALDRDSGEIIWRTTITGGAPLGGVISAPAYADGTIFVASNQFAASSSLVVAIDAANGDIRWRESYSGLTYGGVAYANGVVYVASEAGGIYAYDAESGSTLWADRAPDGQPVAGSPTVASGRLIVPWGYQWTLREGGAGRGGMTVYGL